MPPRLDRPRVRCAVYTRQSVDRDLDYSSCDAQREACEAFVGSMQYEGWELVDYRFDDVGVRGGSLERLALMRLVAAISSGLVDAVVVQRFDRLTRSVRDWSRLHELFERTGVELVVVAAGPDAADDWIAEEIREGDVVITADLPLAARCLAVGAAALGTNGREFTADSIGGALATREIKAGLRESGVSTGGPPPLSARDRSRFSNELDRIVQREIRAESARRAGAAGAAGPRGTS